MQVDAWSPEQYERFKDERAAPFRDLLALLQPVPGGQLVDLGCGTGALTRLAHETLGAAETLGIDSSAAMLHQAAAHAGDGVGFASGDIGFGSGDISFVAEGAARFDVVLSNAALQWLPDHRVVLERWAARLRPGGQLAVQVPANPDHPSHLTAVEVANEAEFAADFDGEPPPDPVRSVLGPEEYACVLAEIGCREQHVRLQVYGHWLPSTAALVEWVEGTSLTRFKRVLSPERYDAFVERYRARLVEKLGDAQPYFYPFKRILFWART